MTNLRQAAQQALEALEDERYVTKYTHIVEAITALHKALEQPSQEPVAQITPPGPITQYRIPTQRPWVGLTDEEILRADPWMGTSDSDINPYQILLKVRTLEAKLKERNT